MPTRLCTTPGCPNPTHHRGRCTTHARTNNRDTHRHRHIYNSRRWKYLRRAVIQANPLCPCGAIATDVDHITPIGAGGQPFDPTNLQAICHTCHSVKTRQEQWTS